MLKVYESYCINNLASDNTNNSNNNNIKNELDQ